MGELQRLKIGGGGTTKAQNKFPLVPLYFDHWPASKLEDEKKMIAVILDSSDCESRLHIGVQYETLITSQSDDRVKNDCIIVAL